MRNQTILRRFMEMLKESERQHPGKCKRLRISRSGLRDWQKLKQSDWEADGWGGEDQDLTCLDRSGEAFLQALRRRLERVGISVVEIAEGPDMEVLPVVSSD